MLFELDRRDKALLVPNAALRWAPSTEMIAPEFRDRVQTNENGETILAQSEPSASQPATDAGGKESQGVLWVADGSYVRPVSVRVGATDSSETEISGEGLTEGMKVVTGIERQATAGTDTSNPFMPKMPKFKKGGGPPPPP